MPVFVVLSVLQVEKLVRFVAICGKSGQSSSENRPT